MNEKEEGRRRDAGYYPCQFTPGLWKQVGLGDVWTLLLFVWRLSYFLCLEHKKNNCEKKTKQREKLDLM